MSPVHFKTRLVLPLAISAMRWVQKSVAVHHFPQSSETFHLIPNFQNLVHLEALEEMIQFLIFFQVLPFGHSAFRCPGQYYLFHVKNK